MAIASFAIAQNTIAQNLDLQSPANNLKQQISSIFPIVASILFIVVALVNLGHFTKEGGDWKKGVFSIVLYCVIVGVIVSLYQYVGSTSL
ncbi:hypothetical protein QW060_23840 [Myroides ceti]|uniref:TrbC/VIRB2 family protein n=1 Tax=Paenimyroides ceti TaxID=395087 RepID=A0ABT8D030_9FLAO|nr:hypothetical protein [Paenimyroides ceti]MDN3709937.1 hypothetical protein [Paenimyroides ceti]